MVAMLNTVVNFSLYCFASKTFRATVQQVIHSVPLPCTLKSHLEGTMVDPVLLKPLELSRGAEL